MESVFLLPVYRGYFGFLCERLDNLLPGFDGSFKDGDAVINLEVKRKFSIIPGSVRKWSETMGRHSLLDREDTEMCTPMCGRIIDVIAGRKLPERGEEVPVTIYSVAGHDIDENIEALKEVVKYLEWLKIGSPVND